MVKDWQSIIYVGAKETLLSKFPPSLDTVILETEELNIGVDAIRDLKTQVFQKPITSKNKTIVIADAQKLTEEAQNTLLKTLEEPPEETIIILITPTLATFLPTVVSRCQIVYLPKTPVPSPDAQTQKIFLAIAKNDLAFGFAWAAKNTDRQIALSELDKLLIACGPKPLARRLLLAKKHLSANTNVRLTLENLFLD